MWIESAVFDKCAFQRKKGKYLDKKGEIFEGKIIHNL